MVNAHAAAEVLGQIGAGVALVREVQQRQAVGLVEAFEAQRELVGLPVHLDLLLQLAVPRGGEPHAEGLAARQHLDDGGGQVATAHVGDERLRDDGGLGHLAIGCGAKDGVGRKLFPHLGEGPELADAELEGQLRARDFAFQVRLGNHRGATGEVRVVGDGQHVPAHRRGEDQARGIGAARVDEGGALGLALAPQRRGDEQRRDAAVGAKHLEPHGGASLAGSALGDDGGHDMIGEDAVGRGHGHGVRRRDVHQHGVGPVLTDFQGEREARVADFALCSEEGFRDGDDFVVVRERLVDEGEFVDVEILGVVPRLAFLEAHGAFGGKHVGAELAEEQEDDAEVRHENAGAPPGPVEAREVRREQAGEQRAADGVAAGENEPRHLRAEERRADDNPALEEAGLRVVEALVDLRQRADEDEHEAQRQQDDGELEGGEEFNYAGHEIGNGGWGIGNRAARTRVADGAHPFAIRNSQFVILFTAWRI